MARVDVDVDVTELLRAIEDYERAGGDMQKTMRLVALSLVEAVDDEFETEGRGQWPGHAPATLARRAGGKLLQDSGVLAGSIGADWGPRHAEANTNVAYAVHHVFGAPAANIPERNPFDVPDKVFEDAAELIASAIADA